MFNINRKTGLELNGSEEAGSLVFRSFILLWNKAPYKAKEFIVFRNLFVPNKAKLCHSK